MKAKPYTVIEYTEDSNGQNHREISRRTCAATDAHEAIFAYYDEITLSTGQPGKDAAHVVLANGHKVSAEPADREDLTPAPQSPQFGALREAIARALIAEQLCEAAVAELARVAGLPVDTAYTCMLSLSEWIPGDPITDEQCKAFIETPQEADAE